MRNLYNDKALVLILLFSYFFNYKMSSQNCASSSNIYLFKYQGKNYEIIKEKKSWNKACKCAVERGGYLAHIESKEEQDSIYYAITSGAAVSTTYATVIDGGGVAYVWIGATDNITEGKWIWDGANSGTGTNFWNGQGTAGAGGGSVVASSYINWGGLSKGSTPKEPDNFFYIRDQDAAAIALKAWPSGSGGNGIAGEWNDIDTANSLYYVVEYNKIGTGGINAIDESIYNVNIYPNPVKESLSISVANYSEKSFRVNIFNMLGESIYSKNDFVSNETINFSAISNGYYFIEVISKDFANRTKVVVNNF